MQQSNCVMLHRCHRRLAFAIQNLLVGSKGDPHTIRFIVVTIIVDLVKLPPIHITKIIHECTALAGDVSLKIPTEIKPQI